MPILAKKFSEQGWVRPRFYSSIFLGKESSTQNGTFPATRITVPRQWRHRQETRQDPSADNRHNSECHCQVICHYSQQYNLDSLWASSDSSPVSERLRTTYMSEHCIAVSSADKRRHLRSANRHLLAVPHFPLNTYGRRAFSVAGPMAWNSLPNFIRNPTSSIDCFRRLLQTYLFARY